MKLVKSLLLGSAAGLAAAAGAQAADLPFRKAAPVDYVRVCDWVGKPGYFYIPGTDTCLRVGGEVRFEYAYIDPSRSFTPNALAAGNTGTAVPVGVPGVTIGGLGGTINPAALKNASGFFTRGQIQLDARTQTAYGLLRAFISVQADRVGGSENTAFGNGIGTSTYLDKGYITFAGITAGRVQSFFDFYADDYNYDGIANSDQSTQALAYTATFGGGFSATVAVEEANTRRTGINAVAFGNTAIGPNAAPVPALFGATVGYAGERYPDAVGQLHLEQAWGVLQLSAAYHDVNTVSANVGTAAVPVFQTSTAAGYAFQAGVDFKLPMLAAGDELWLEGAYQNGAYNYMDCCSNFSSGFNGLLLGGFTHIDADAVAIGNGAGTGYRLALSEGFSVMGAFHHYFTPQFHDVLYGSYEEVGYGAAKRIDWTRGGIGDASEYRIGNQFIFTPVSKLDIGVDVMYAKLNQSLPHEVGIAPTALPVGITKDPDVFEVRLRLNRDF